ncbi:MAG: HAD-IA family hydrolase, partial [Pseudomonadota bacterium]
GVAETLDALCRAGHRLAICTNKPEAPARIMAEHFDLMKWMDTLVGGDTLSVKKPDPAPLFHAVAATGADKVLYVGDSETDSATAVAAKIPFALFTEGYRKNPVEKIPHQVAFSHYHALRDLAEAALGLPKPGP